MNSKLRFAIAGIFALVSVPSLAQRPQFAFAMPPMGAGDLMRQVIRREEVQSHLHLTVKQKTDLEDLTKNPGVRISVEGHQNSTPEDLRKQVEDQIAKQTLSTGDRFKAILKHEQYKRLEELVLQWKGALSLGNSKVASDLKLDPTHRAEISRLYSDYSTKKQEIIMAGAQVEENNDGPNVRRSVRIDGRKLFMPGSDTFRKLSTLKTEAETKILAVLSAEEKSAWQTAQGESFTYRTDQPSDRF